MLYSCLNGNAFCVLQNDMVPVWICIAIWPFLIVFAKSDKLFLLYLLFFFILSIKELPEKKYAPLKYPALKINHLTFFLIRSPFFLSLFFIGLRFNISYGKLFQALPHFSLEMRDTDYVLSKCWRPYNAKGTVLYILTSISPLQIFITLNFWE